MGLGVPAPDRLRPRPETRTPLVALYPRPGSAGRGRSPGLTLAILPLLLLLACGRDKTTAPTPATGGFGRIYGQVTGGMGGLRTSLTMVELGSDDRRFSADTDTSGKFSVLVPFGRYELTLGIGGSYTRAGLSLGAFDTLVVSTTQPDVQANVIAGTVRMRIHWPASLRGQEQLVRLSLTHGSRGNNLVPPDSLVSDVIFDGLPAGTVQISIEPRSSGYYYVPGVAGPGLNAIPVTAGTVENVEATLPEACTVQGRWQGSWLQLGATESDPFSGLFSGTVGVTGFAGDSTQVLSAGIPNLAGSNGAFSFRVYGPCSARLRISLPGPWSPLPSWWLGGTRLGDAPVYTFQSGQTLVLPDIVESGILGYVDPDVAIPGSDFAVDLTDANGNLISTYSTLSEQPGYNTSNLFCFCGLAPGSYYLRFRESLVSCQLRWVSIWYPAATTLSEASPIEIQNPGDVQELTWSLITGGTIQGSIGLGSFPQECEIRLYAAADSTQPVCTSDLDQASQFYFRGLGNGAYLLEVYTRAAHSWYPGRGSAAGADTLQVRNLTGPPAIKWTLP